MGLKPANHFTLTAKDLSGIVDTTGMTGQPVVSLEFKGRPIENATVKSGPEGYSVSAVIDTVADLHEIELRLVVPEVNVEDEAIPFAAFAVVTTARTSIGGPRLVPGPLHLYELQPVAGIASAVES